MSLALHYRMGGAHRCSGPPVSKMTYTVPSGTLNPSTPYCTVTPVADFRYELVNMITAIFRHLK